MNRKRIGDWAENWIQVSAEGLGLARIFVSLFLLFFLIPGDGTGHFLWLATLPPEFYSPAPGPMMLLEQFPSLFVFQTLQVVILISLIGMLIGFHTRVSSLTAGFSMLLMQGLIFSIGKIDHEILVPMVPIVMAFSNWGCRYSIDAVTGRSAALKPENWPVPVLAILIGFMMFTAGFPKILGGWLDPSTQATYGHLLNQFVVRERQALFAETFIQIQSPVFWEILDWATILFEVGFLAAVYKLSWFRWFLGFAVCFHFSTLMSLNIAFLPNFVAYALFLNWNRIAEIIKKTFADNGSGREAIILALILLLLFGVLFLLSRMDLVLIGSELSLHEIVILSTTFIGIVLYGLLSQIQKIRS